MKYQILRSTSSGWKGKPIVAKLLTNIDIFYISKAVWKPEILNDLPVLEFRINVTEKSLPDFISSGVLWLLSERFTEILRNQGVAFESYPVILNSNKSAISGYHLFHLLQIRPIIDIENSIIHGYENIEKITLLDFDVTPEFSMIRDTFMNSLVFVRDDLVEKMEQDKISGCGWIDPAEYRFILRTKRW